MRSALLIKLLEAAPVVKMGEVVGPILSAMAFILSSSAFIFTVIIQLKERKRNLRQTLSQALSEIAGINVAVSSLKKDEKESTPESVLIRKNYNSQRGTLVAGADFLISQNKKLITDADCELMAMTYDDLGDITKAEEYWLQAIKLALNPAQLHLHQRDYATFLFNNNQPVKARELFEKSLQIDMSKNDYDLRYVVDTYLIWAKLEQNFDNTTEFDRLINLARDLSKNIRHKEKLLEMNRLIDKTVKPD
jgi:tetratricopeptide (TPR) repeat protein